MLMNSAFVGALPLTQRKKADPVLKCCRVKVTCAAQPPTWRQALSTTLAVALVAGATTFALAENLDIRPQLKVSGGSASTSAGVSGARTVVKTVTRGVNLEGADFSAQNFEGVSFQQSILRQANFTNCNLRNASFFDADVSGAKFTNADLSGANVSGTFPIRLPRPF